MTAPRERHVAHRGRKMLRPCQWLRGAGEGNRTLKAVRTSLSFQQLIPKLSTPRAPLIRLSVPRERHVAGGRHASPYTLNRDSPAVRCQLGKPREGSSPFLGTNTHSSTPLISARLRLNSIGFFACRFATVVRRRLLIGLTKPADLTRRRPAECHAGEPR